MAQRLVRTVCHSCWEEVAAGPSEQRELGLAVGTPIHRAGRGCGACKGTGYRGRTGIHEILGIDDDVRTLVMQRSDAAAIRRLATSRGMATLREDGARKVRAGVTTAEEVLRVTQDDVV
jgi:type II secretory ATPase GspE/PulE/Tfp pilus assembly ATPase PilB-like protein